MKFMRFVALTLLLLAGCGGDPHEDLYEEMFALTDGVISTLAGVESADDVDRASQELLDATKAFVDLAGRALELGAPSPEQRDALKEKYGARMSETRARLDMALSQLEGIDSDLRGRLVSAVQAAMAW